MYKNILVPLDGSKQAEAVLPYAKLLASGLELPVELLHVNEPETVAPAIHPSRGSDYLKDKRGRESFYARAFILFIMGLSLAAVGCSNTATATLSPGVDLSGVKSYYVVHQPKDTHNLHFLIRDRIIKEGLTARAGPESEKTASPVNAVVTYVDRWMWDFTLYLLELTVTFRDATNDFPLAVGQSYHTSLTRLSPEEMVEEVITNIFNAAKQAAKPGPP